MAMAGPTGGFGPGPLTAIDDYWTLDHQRPLRMGRDCPNSNSERVSHKNHASKGNGGKSLAVAASKSPRRHTGLSSCRPVNSAVDVILLARFFVGGSYDLLSLRHMHSRMAGLPKVPIEHECLPQRIYITSIDS
ncbi:hypothetical protein E4U54_002810 [Claviceps lovelessii]|nr:hypothetical protein E4U54_002810 [Claviceps lovelessii]